MPALKIMLTFVENPYRKVARLQCHLYVIQFLEQGWLVAGNYLSLACQCVADTVFCCDVMVNVPV